MGDYSLIYSFHNGFRIKSEKNGASEPLGVLCTVIPSPRFGFSMLDHSHGVVISLNNFREHYGQ